MSEEQEEVRFTDRRAAARLQADEEAKAQDAPPPQTPAAEDDEVVESIEDIGHDFAQAAEAGPTPEQLAAFYRVETVMLAMIEQLETIAWARLGLRPLPFANKIEQDLKEARAAIDLLGDVIARFEQMHGESEARDLKVLLSNLRINFVKQSSG